MLPAPYWNLVWIHYADVSSVPAFIGHGKIQALSSSPRFGSDLGGPLRGQISKYLQKTFHCMKEV